MKKTARKATKKAKSKSEIILPKKNNSKPNKVKLDNMSFFQKWKYKRQMRKDKQARKRAESLASLPKDPVKRFFAHFHPKRVFHYWFSWYGFKKVLKFLCACFLIGVIAVGGLFLYYKKEVKDLESQLSNIHIQDTVNTYLDRNGEVLWQDTGNEDYRIAVDGSEISTYMRQATVAIEDKNFYNHPGVDLGALVRATLSTLSGKGVQGGSTLTQQLIKQLYFSDEASSENRGGIARKIKELILSMELEKTYEKEQIITMYLNESPYGGRRNGVESAARTYFNKSAADLNLAESALLAAIPNNPGVLNPYNVYGNDMLIERQHKVLDGMVEIGAITREEAEETKEVAILDQIQPESSQYEGMKAPHFVLEVRKQLEDKYGIQTMRAGGFTITTTLDYRAQKIAEDAVAVGAANTYVNHSDDIALVSVDVETSQVVAMVGSIDFFNGTYGEVNATTDSLIEPGSTIKPILDYAPLFMQRDGQNFGPGSILKDENINALYCKGYSGSCSMTNATGQFYGNVTIRFSLGHSLNIAAVKALYINGIENSLEVAHALGDVSYCADRDGNYGLSIAIGSGCGVRMVEHANAYASLARGGAYKDLSYVLEVKNSSGDILETWSDTPSVRVVDEQVAYMISNVLSDHSARWFNNEGFVVPGVWTATKTGTTTTTNSAVTKDSLMESYSTALSTLVWNGNHDGSGLSSNSNNVVRYTIGTYMERVHKEVYEPEGKWSPNNGPAQPAGIQKLTVNGKTDIWPSWYNSKTSGVTKTALNFNKFTHKLASSCTPDSHIISVEVSKTIDPMTKEEVWDVPEPYTRDESDACPYSYTYRAPTVEVSVTDYIAYIDIYKGSEALSSYTIYVNGTSFESKSISESVSLEYELPEDASEIKVVATDVYGESGSDQDSF